MIRIWKTGPRRQVLAWAAAGLVLFSLVSCGRAGVPTRDFSATAKLTPEAAGVLELVSTEGKVRNNITWIVVKLTVQKTMAGEVLWINAKASSGAVSSKPFPEGLREGVVVEMEVACPDKGNPVAEIVSVTTSPLATP